MDTHIITDRVYISGPVTGLSREQCRSRFMLAERLLRQAGYRNVVNPVRLWVSRRWIFRVIGYRLTILYDLWLLTGCQRIYKMPGWKQSRGAQIESCVAYHFAVYNLAKPVRQVLDGRIGELIAEQEEQEARPEEEKGDKV